MKYVVLILLAFNISKADVGIKSQDLDIIRVLVIDTGIGYHDKLFKYVQYDGSNHYIDNHGHGTHVTGIILYGNDKLSDPVCDQIRIYSCKYGDPYSKVQSSHEFLKGSVECAKLVESGHFDYVNYSSSGNLSFSEFESYRKFTSKGGVLVTAAGNDSQDLERNPVYPAGYAIGFDFDKFNEKTKNIKKIHVKPLNNVIIVQNECRDGLLCKTSNRYPLALRAMGDTIYSTLPYNKYGLMSGTSQAAPQILHTILKQRCKELKSNFQAYKN